VAGPDDDLEARVSARDVSALAAKLDAHTRVLNALRETQLEQGHRIDGLSHRIDGLEHEMRQGFAMMATGMARITALLEDTVGS
jgi:hypothetical protein